MLRCTGQGCSARGRTEPVESFETTRPAGSTLDTRRLLRPGVELDCDGRATWQLLRCPDKLALKLSGEECSTLPAGESEHTASWAARERRGAKVRTALVVRWPCDRRAHPSWALPYRTAAPGQHP